MRVIRGNNIGQMDEAELTAWAVSKSEIVIDLGAGDGRFVRYLASHRDDIGAIGVDLCEQNLRKSRAQPKATALLVVADALALPKMLAKVANRVTVSFPWGSPLAALLTGDQVLLAGLPSITRDGAVVEITVNAGALATHGYSLDTGRDRRTSVLCSA